MNYRIPLSYTPIDEEAIGTVLRQYTKTSHAELIADFEGEISRITGARYVVAVNSGTAAIHLALKALNVGAGHKVATSAFTYVASVNPVLYQGAEPVLIDSEADTWNIDPDLLEKCLRDEAGKIKAIVVVHGYGVPAKMDEILSVARKYDVPVIEDAAEALGSTYRGIHLGALSDIGILSFNNNKIITTYGGGAVLTNDEATYKRIVYWASQSRVNKPYYEHLELGYNYRMSPLNATCGLAYISTLPSVLQQRANVRDQYRHAFTDGSFVSFPLPQPNAKPNYWLTTLLLDALEKRGKSVLDVVADMAAKGIETRPLWNPMHRQPLYSKMKFYGSGVSDLLFRKGVCLPSGKELLPDTVVSIAEALMESLR